MLENFVPMGRIYPDDGPPYNDDGRGTCVCGATVHITSTWANQCPGCNREYNGSGQELAPRSQWGEETGESVFDMERDWDGEDDY